MQVPLGLSGHRQLRGGYHPVCSFPAGIFGEEEQDGSDKGRGGWSFCQVPHVLRQLFHVVPGEGHEVHQQVSFHHASLVTEAQLPVEALTQAPVIIAWLA